MRAFTLYDVIKNINSSITFWLDGHYSGYDTAQGDENNPILKELEQIKKHHIKNHTILIDDIRLCGGFWFDDITLEQIISKILEINKNYTISYVDGYVKNDILVAQIQNNDR